MAPIVAHLNAAIPVVTVVLGIVSLFPFWDLVSASTSSETTWR